MKLLLITTGRVLPLGRIRPSYTRAVYSKESEITKVKSMAHSEFLNMGFILPASLELPIHSASGTLGDLKQCVFQEEFFPWGSIMP